MKEMIIDQDPALMAATDEYSALHDLDIFKRKALRRVVEETVNVSYSLYQTIFTNFSLDVAKSLSKQGLPSSSNESKERHEILMDTHSQTYGEIDFFSFCAIMEKARVQPGDTFLDLGHGSGRALIAAALVYGDYLTSISGIELIPSLYDASLQVINNYQQQTVEYDMKKVDIRVVCGNMLELDWNADIVFANSTCFTEDLMVSIARLAEDRMKVGSRFISLTKRLPSEQFELIERRQYPMSWGPATAFILIKKAS